MGSRHAEVVQRNPHSDLVVVVDIDPTTAKRCAERHGCRAATELVLPVDIAIVATPSDTHLRVAQHALSHASWCLVEKPFLLPGQHLAHPKVLVSHPERFHGALEGFSPKRISTFSSTRESPPPTPTPADDVFLDLLVHDLDLLCRWTTPVALLESRCHLEPDGRIEAGEARYQLEGGGIATLKVSRAAAERRRTVQWISEEGATQVDLTTVADHTPTDGPLDRQWEAVLCTMRGEQPSRPPATSADGERVVALAAAALQRALQAAQG